MSLGLSIIYACKMLFQHGLFYNIANFNKHVKQLDYCSRKSLKTSFTFVPKSALKQVS